MNFVNTEVTMSHSFARHTTGKKEKERKKTKKINLAAFATFFSFGRFRDDTNAGREKIYG